jgi:DNA (cytosine-5)-methyltransferase 1
MGMKLRVFEAFSGIGAQAMALKRLFANYPNKVEFDYVGTSEIESTAIKAYESVHGAVPCFGDIRHIDWVAVPDFDIFTMSSPCQDFSVAGRGKGGLEGSNTRSSLLWECRKAILAKRPKYILFENVAAVKNRKHVKIFNKWQHELESYGYTNFCSVLDARDYGVAQHRERLFMVSILDCTYQYYFPKPFKLEKRLKDYLEPTVPESYYLTAKQLSRVIEHCDKKQSEGCGFKTQFCKQDGIASTILARYGQRETDPYVQMPIIGISLHPLCRKMEFRGYRSINFDVAPTLTAHDAKAGQPCLWEIMQLYPGSGNPQSGRIYDINGISPNLDTCAGGNRMPKVLEPVILSLPHGYFEGGESEIAPCVKASAFERNNYVKELVDNTFLPSSILCDEHEMANDQVLVDSESGRAYYVKDGWLWRIRKLMPSECLRLMAVSEDDIKAICTCGISNTAIYALAGNSIVVDVLYHIFYKLFIDKENQEQQLTFF